MVAVALIKVTFNVITVVKSSEGLWPVIQDIVSYCSHEEPGVHLLD